ncbi:MAG: Uma2 family endonuclease [Lachnospiraceae bacterium]
MTIEEMKRRKREMGYSYLQISQMSGVPLGTVQKIFGGMTSAPRYQTLQALEKIFRSTEIQERTLNANDEKRNLGDEMLQGANLDTIHQLICSQIHVQLAVGMEVCKKEGVVLAYPIPVQLGGAGKHCEKEDIVRPDLIVVCDRAKLLKNCVCGTPDLIVEVIDTEEKKKSLFLKADQYMSAGVSEYWVVDAQKKVVLVYHFAKDVIPIVYDFQDQIPVRLLENKIMINCKRIQEQMDWIER